MSIVILRQAERELKGMPLAVKADVFALFDELAAGKTLGMPISRPLGSIARGLHELRLSGRAGEFRVFYFIRVGDAVYIIHAVQKKTQKTERKTIELLKARIRSLGL